MITLGNKKRITLIANVPETITFSDYIKSVQLIHTAGTLYLSTSTTAGNNDESNYINAGESITLNTDRYFNTLSVMSTATTELQIVNPIFYREA